MHYIDTTNAPGAIGSYLQALEVNGMIFTSGQFPVDHATGEVPEGIAAQAEQSIKNVKAILEEVGSSLGNVVKTESETYNPTTKALYTVFKFADT